ncbi:MAG: hypothetical protein JWL97_4258 [Gemmatimonadales bacterium]|nr:hypothetical protein [Gemmatimonadales bacterium]
MNQKGPGGLAPTEAGRIIHLAERTLEMHVQATADPRTTGTALGRACSRCGTRLSRYNPDDVCSACSRSVETANAEDPRPAQYPLPEINRANANIITATRCVMCGCHMTDDGHVLTLAARLREERVTRLWSQKTMASRLRDAADDETRRHLPPVETLRRYVRWYEAGSHQPGDLYAQLYCRAFGLTHTDLFAQNRAGR